MASSKWKTWEELSEITHGKTVIFWGASNWVERTIDILPVKAAYIVDNNPNNLGIQYAGLNVDTPQKLLNENKDDIYIIICTGNYVSVIDELEELGFVMGDNYCVSPLMNERKNKDDFKNVDRTILVSSPQHIFKDDCGGGIYECYTKTNKVKKVYTGKARGMSYCGDKLLIIDMLRGIVILDKDYNDVGCIELQSNCEAHGLHYDEMSERIFVGQPGRDSIAIYCAKNKSLVKEISISDKWEKNKKDNHHVNDVYVQGNSLFVSMFSFSGNWMNEVYDGGIVEIDIETGEILNEVVSGLWMPHSVSRYNGQLCYVDSMRGALYNTTWKKVGHFYSFIRGLDFDGDYYYVGTSEHRYPEKLLGVSENISLDTGFFIFNPETKMSRLFQLTETETVHSVLVKKGSE